MAENQSNAGNSSDVSNAQEHLRAAKEAAVDAGRHAYDDARDRAGAAYEQVRQRATDYAEQGRDKLSDVEDYIRREPVKGLMIAAGVGLVLGLYLRR